jgi:hypothetical protein
MRRVTWTGGQATEAIGPPWLLRVPRQRAAKSEVEAELACSARARRYVFHYDEVAEAEAQGLPYVLVPRELSCEEWEKKYCTRQRG